MNQAKTTEKRLACIALIGAVATEAMPEKQFKQFLVGMIPIIGNARSLQSAAKSTKDAIAAFEAEDPAQGFALGGMALLGIVGGVAGLGTPAVAATRASVRATIGRNVRNGKSRLREFIDQADRARRYVKEGERPGGTMPESWAERLEFARQDAAMKRVEEWANRSPHKQLEHIAKPQLDYVFSALPDGIRSKMEVILRKSIGDAGELAFEGILQRMRPGTLSEAQATTLAIQALKYGKPEYADEAKKLLAR